MKSQTQLAFELVASSDSNLSEVRQTSKEAIAIQC